MNTTSDMSSLHWLYIFTRHCAYSADVISLLEISFILLIMPAMLLLLGTKLPFCFWSMQQLQLVNSMSRKEELEAQELPRAASLCFPLLKL
jgi:hypothetical protein